MKDCESKQSGIYLITFENGKRYVGKANNFKVRYSRYKKDFQRKSGAIHAAMNKYGWGNFEFRIIEITDKMPLNEILLRESLWIKFYRSLVTQNGYNVCEYSTDCTGYKWTEEQKARLALRPRKSCSEETKLKISAGNKGKIRSEEYKQKVREINLGKKHSEETKAKISLKLKGKVRSPEVIENQRQSLLGKRLPEKAYLVVWRKNRKCPHSKETKIKMSLCSPYSKEVLQYDLKGNFIQSFRSMKEAQKSLGINRSGYLAVRIREGKPYKGFMWKFAQEESNAI